MSEQDDRRRPGDGASESDGGAVSLSDTIGEFAELVAAGTPTPGGGSVAAHCGVLAAALGRMVCNLTVGKPKYAEVEARAKAIESQLDELGRALRELIASDARSFEDVLKAYRLPKDTDEQKSERKERIEKATRGSIEVPMNTARRSSEVLDLLRELADIGNPNAFPDLTMGGRLAVAAAKGAYYNVGVNLASLDDARAAGEINREIEGLIARTEKLFAEIEKSMMSRIAPSKN